VIYNYSAQTLNAEPQHAGILAISSAGHFENDADISVEMLLLYTKQL